MKLRLKDTENKVKGLEKQIEEWKKSIMMVVDRSLCNLGGRAPHLRLSTRSGSRLCKLGKLRRAIPRNIYLWDISKRHSVSMHDQDCNSQQSTVKS